MVLTNNLKGIFHAWLLDFVYLFYDSQGRGIIIIPCGIALFNKYTYILYYICINTYIYKYIWIFHYIKRSLTNYVFIILYFNSWIRRMKCLQKEFHQLSERAKWGLSFPKPVEVLAQKINFFSEHDYSVITLLQTPTILSIKNKIIFWLMLIMGWNRRHRDFEVWREFLFIRAVGGLL